VDVSSAELSRIRITNVDQVELREALAETREEMASIKLSGTKRRAMNSLIGIRPAQFKETVGQPQLVGSDFVRLGGGTPRSLTVTGRDGPQSKLIVSRSLSSTGSNS
jgi:hypothetical protein